MQVTTGKKAHTVALAASPYFVRPRLLPWRLSLRFYLQGPLARRLLQPIRIARDTLSVHSIA